MPLYCAASTETKIRETFSYSFKAEAQRTCRWAMCRSMVFNRISEGRFDVLGQRVVPIPLIHAQFNVFGFRIDDVAYCTDVSKIPPESWPRLEGLKVLVLDALRPKPHPGHFSLDQALEVIVSACWDRSAPT